MPGQLAIVSCSASKRSRLRRAPPSVLDRFAGWPTGRALPVPLRKREDALRGLAADESRAEPRSLDSSRHFEVLSCPAEALGERGRFASARPRASPRT
ncbi:hypothetical protein KM043_002121 [Ampulex compressa]|nr:hypothetical protein KM043_002121 [Ampulex compressa]